MRNGFDLILIILMCLAISLPITEGVGCLQCNMFIEGVQDVCDISERQMYNCTACLKTFTLTYMHDQWRQYRYTTVISKYCVKPRQFKLAEGCYTTEAAAGFVRRCYCYTENCNKGTTVGTNCVPIILGFIIGAIINYKS